MPEGDGVLLGNGETVLEQQCEFLSATEMFALK